MTALQKFSNEMRRNRRLQVGVAIIAFVVLWDRAAAWYDRLEGKQQALTQLQIEVSTLKGQARNEVAMQAAIREIRKAAALADARVWVVPSEGIGQARLKDWLVEQMKLAGAGNYTVNLSTPKPLAESAQGSPPSVAPVGVLGPSQPPILEFNAVLTFTFTPESLEKILAAVEAGDTMAKVESLSVRRNDRRVELGVRVLMRLKEVTS